MSEKPESGRLQIKSVPSDVLELLDMDNLGEHLRERLQGVVDLDHLAVMAINEGQRASRTVMMLRVLIGLTEKGAARAAPTPSVAQRQEPAMATREPPRPAPSQSVPQPESPLESHPKGIDTSLFT